MTRIALIVFVFLISNICIGQGLIDKNLAQFQWTTDSTINGVNLGKLKEIGLSKLRVTTDSIKKDCSLWTFSENKITIQKYSSANGMESDTIVYSYEYKNGELLIHDFAQDSTVWKYKVGITSSENFILLMRKKK